jgi:uncharacterized membrane protein
MSSTTISPLFGNATPDVPSIPMSPAVKSFEVDFKETKKKGGKTIKESYHAEESTSKKRKGKKQASWGWLGALILWFIIFTVLFWLIFYSLKPSFCLHRDNNQTDTGKVLLGSVISAFLLILVIWAIKMFVNRC